VKVIISVLTQDLMKLVSPYTNGSVMQLQYIDSTWMQKQNISKLQSVDNAFKGRAVA
jgi:hypothetical protein